MELTKFRSQLSIASEQISVSLQRTENALASVRARTTDALLKVGAKSETYLLKLRETLHGAAAFAGGQIAKVGVSLSGATRQVEFRINTAQNSAMTLVKNVVETPRRQRDARRAKENELHNLLSNSLDAMVVTDAKHRLVEANPSALDLFGISELNSKYFTIDTFIARYESLDDTNPLPVSNQLEIHGRCKIRRLDGALRVAECHFVPDVVPRRHLYEFLNIAPYKLTPFRFDARKATRRTKLARRNVPFVM